MKRPSSSKLKELRLAKKLTYQHLSVVTDIDRRTLSEWEKTPSPYYNGIVLTKLADFYGVTTDSLLEEMTDDEVAAVPKPGRPRNPDLGITLPEPEQVPA
ncbi:helix-turn-helix domain-containing protein (plasmid) [Deinococcus sp. KNUC1210]|uniref:helix-turn-helix transcriptional regulator n=1 Tax=Deinococcus sp. KNUC1210 TaxID=2917691 RepID=UPI001EF14EAD|nr:helix-turn-helix transcriptional regulator [Deinococcus sp. KNUC1210]ULH17411.1 helix-turn-helix domain-containing protein [Deinococcus sp. KNUC1210]